MTVEHHKKEKLPYDGSREFTGFAPNGEVKNKSNQPITVTCLSKDGPIWTIATYAKQ